jgi:hypothetical protein
LKNDCRAESSQKSAPGARLFSESADIGATQPAGIGSCSRTESACEGAGRLRQSSGSRDFVRPPEPCLPARSRCFASAKPGRRGKPQRHFSAKSTKDTKNKGAVRTQSFFVSFVLLVANLFFPAALRLCVNFFGGNLKSPKSLGTAGKRQSGFSNF